MGVIEKLLSVSACFDYKSQKTFIKIRAPYRYSPIHLGKCPKMLEVTVYYESLSSFDNSVNESKLAARLTIAIAMNLSSQ